MRVVRAATSGGRERRRGGGLKRTALRSRIQRRLSCQCHAQHAADGDHNDGAKMTNGRKQGGAGPERPDPREYLEKNFGHVADSSEQLEKALEPEVRPDSDRLKTSAWPRVLKARLVFQLLESTR